MKFFTSNRVGHRLGHRAVSSPHVSTKRIYIVHTGGTIGMRRGPRGYEPAAGFLAERMAEMPEFSSPALPDWELFDFDPLLDSSNMSAADWRSIGRAIADRYDAFDGFIVIHGTDTMAFSASATSFMLSGLDKPVVFTGSQIPLAEVRSDARENLITSLLVAADHPVPEVSLCFGDHLYRGNRATKVSARGFEAFASPNYPPLGRVGIDIAIEHDLVRRPDDGGFRFRDVAQPEITDIRVFPGITPTMLRRFLERPLDGAVLHTYGVGNAPDHPDLLRALREASDRGVVIVNCTQCLAGSVDMRGYVTGTALADAGVVSGYDMTPEAALTKLFLLLSTIDDPERARREVGRDLRGELTAPSD